MLKEEGVVYISPPRVFRHLRSVPIAYRVGALDGAAWTAPDIELVHRCQKALQKKTRGRKNDRFLMSWEAFSGDPYSGYSNAFGVANALRRITSEFDVRIVVYLRRQDEFIESLFAQIIMAGRSMDFQEFMDRHPYQGYSWETLVEAFATNFGTRNIIVRRYGPAYLEEGLLVDFGRAIGSDGIASGVEDVAVNQGPSSYGLEIARLANPHLTKNERKRLRLALQRDHGMDRFSRRSYLDPDTRDAILGHHELANNRVARRYLGQTDLFSGVGGDSAPPDPIQSLTSGSDESSETAARVMAVGIARKGWVGEILWIARGFIRKIRKWRRRS
jgi:hypothetical protein